MPFLVLDLSEFRCRRFYDLLGLYDIAHCLVTVDTGHLHLAHASHVPVVSFITRDPDPWHGSAWRGNHVGRYYYDELPGCLSSAMVRTLAADKPDTRTKIIHAFADDRVPEPGSDLARRISVAQASWETEYAISGRWISGEWQQEKADRSGKEIGDPATVPYVHDVVKCGLAASTQEADIIALTNSDVGFTPGLSGWVLEACERHGCAWTHRRDFPRIEKPFVSETAVRYGKFYPGTDAFFFTVKWWREHGKEYGDFLMGREFWDEVLRQLMKYHGGAGIENAIWHEWHESFWCGALREKLPGNLHNKWLREVWFAETGFIPEDFRYFRTNAEATMHAHPRK